MIDSLLQSCNLLFRRAGFLFFAGCLLCSNVGGQVTKQSTFEEALSRVRSQIVVGNGILTGAGAEVLTKAVSSSRFVLLGEDHFSRETPELAASLCDIIQPDVYAIEVGPQAASYVGGLVKASNRVDLTRQRLAKYPQDMAFLDMREENDLAAHCAASSHNPHFQLWGLDQEFIGSAGLLLDAMENTHPGPRSLNAITAAKVEARKAEAQARKSGRAQDLYLLDAPDSAAASLETAISKDGKAETKDLLREFLISRHIYQMQLKGMHEAGMTRAQLLKQHFMSDYRAYEAANSAPRVFIKFGGMHTGKGFNFIHLRDLGNFVAEQADLEGTSSLHIFAMGARGEHSYPGPYGQKAVPQPFDLSHDEEWSWLNPALKQVSSSSTAGSTTWTQFDLRQLRFQKIDFPPGWEHLVYSYDLLLLSPTFTPSTPIE